jgi:hypothetical protein
LHVGDCPWRTAPRRPGSITGLYSPKITALARPVGGTRERS